MGVLTVKLQSVSEVSGNMDKLRNAFIANEKTQAKVLDAKVALNKAKMDLDSELKSIESLVGMTDRSADLLEASAKQLGLDVPQIVKSARGVSKGSMDKIKTIRSSNK